ncbi:MAG: linear amide C-N hydrolase [Flavobacteriaceae bacterium]|nr:linear amide C-N hydrolase [Flavobacteriaceae bacterium]
MKGKLGVLTNEPSFEWQFKNLSNYVSITPVNAVNKNELTNNFTLGGPW